MEEVRANRVRFYEEQKNLKSFSSIFESQAMKTNEYPDDVDVEDAEADFM